MWTRSAARTGRCPTYLKLLETNVDIDPAWLLRQVNIAIPRFGMAPRSGANRRSTLAAGLSVDHLGRYPTARWPLCDAAFARSTGHHLRLVGINGSGKSTLFKAIMGLRASRRTARCASMAGVPWAALKRNMIAYVPQSEEVDWNFPVGCVDVVMMGRYGHMGISCAFRAPPTAWQAVDAALARVGMADLRRARSASCPAGRRSACSWPARWPRAASRSSCSTSPSPAST